MLNQEIDRSLVKVCSDLNINSFEQKKIIKFLEYLTSGTSSESDQNMYIKNILEGLKD